ncbi:MAG: TatD family hydrolase [Candidatus Nanohaloarchaea archaeon]
MKPVDAHCHVDFRQYDDDRDEIIERAADELEFIVDAGSSYENNKEVLELAENHRGFIIPNLGIHPTYTDDFDDLDKIKDQVRKEDPAAVGEIGLDNHHVEDEDMRERQTEVFREMVELAEELGKPVVVHSRDAERKAFKILKEYDLPGVMLHCFNGRPELAEEAVEEGMLIGVTTQVLYSTRVNNIVQQIPVENMLLETDSPFLYRGERNEPGNVKESAEKIGEIKDLEVEKVVEATTKNAQRLFL